MRKAVVLGIAAILVIATGAGAQEIRNELSIQGTGFFTQDTNNQGISRTSTNSGGLLAGYRYSVNRWLSADLNYGFTRNTQQFVAAFGSSRVQSDVHAATADLVLNLPVHLFKFSPYVLGGGGGLIFRPTGNAFGSVLAADTQARGTFLYGVGADYPLLRHVSLRGEYRGFVYKAPDFGLSRLNTDAWTHTAQPSAGLVFRF